MTDSSASPVAASTSEGDESTATASIFADARKSIGLQGATYPGPVATDLFYGQKYGTDPLEREKTHKYPT